MQYSRTEQAAEILEESLERYGFNVSGERMADGSIAMACIAHENGITGDYEIEIIRDDSGTYGSTTQVSMSVRLRRGEEYTAIYDGGCFSISIHEISVEIEPSLKAYLGWAVVQARSITTD